MMNVKFKTDNAAFDGDNKAIETARLLREIADRIERGEEAGMVRDLNGNRVGDFKLR